MKKKRDKGEVLKKLEKLYSENSSASSNSFFATCLVGILVGVLFWKKFFRSSQNTDRNIPSSIVVTEISFWHINVPLKKAFYPSWIPGYPQTHNKFTLVEIKTNKGYVGYSVGVAFAEEREGIGSLLAPYLLGKDALDIERVHQLLIEASFLGWRNFWIENAFYDIIAQVKGVPLWKYLHEEVYGNETESIVKEEKKIPVYLSTGSLLKPKYHGKIIKKAIEKEGFHGVKVRVKGKTVEEDVAVMKELRKRIGMEIGPIMIDVNQGWRVTLMDPDTNPKWDYNRALNFTKEMEKLNISWIEEPFEMHEYENYSKLRKVLKKKHVSQTLLIAGAELSYGWNEFRMFLMFNSIDIFQPDVTFCGIYDAIKLIKEINNFNSKKKDISEHLYFSPHTWSNGLGIILNLHVMIVANNSKDISLEFPLEKGTWIPKYRDAIINPIFPNKNGYLELPKEVGVGLKERIDFDLVEKYGEKFFTMTKRDLSMKVLKEKGLFNSIRIWLKKK